MTDHELLGVRVGASDAELKAAYRRKQSELHPDAVNGKRRSQGLEPDPKADERFRALEEAFARLARGNNGGELPEWARSLMGRLDLVGEAAKRGDLPEMFGELSQFAAEVQGRVQDVAAQAAHVGTTIQDGLQQAESLGRGIINVISHFKRGHRG